MILCQVNFYKRIDTLQEEQRMFSYARVQERPSLFLAMTGLTLSEFDQLLPAFQQAWEAYLHQDVINRPDRQRQYGGGQHESTLVPIEDKLLFILYYLKVYPLQEILAFEFAMTQSTANEWIHILSPVLQNALGRGGHLPERNPARVVDALQHEADPASEYGLDGTERRRQRPKDQETQRRYYSGKKKTHTIKNLIIGGLTTRTVTYLSATYEGRLHDKTIADDEHWVFPDDIALYKDSGFQGYEPDNVRTFQPQKKPQGQALTLRQKAQNRLIAKIRIVIEHILAGIKRCRIVKEVFRNTKACFDDLVMELACGLHNFRVHYRYT
jgi:hypothetical protein